MFLRAMRLIQISRKKGGEKFYISKRLRTGLIYSAWTGPRNSSLTHFRENADVVHDYTRPKKDTDYAYACSRSIFSPWMKPASPWNRCNRVTAASPRLKFCRANASLKKFNPRRKTRFSRLLRFSSNNFEGRTFLAIESKRFRRGRKLDDKRASNTWPVQRWTLLTKVQVRRTNTLASAAPLCVTSTLAHLRRSGDSISAQWENMATQKEKRHNCCACSSVKVI